MFEILMERFPESKDKIKKYLDQDENFKELCENYEDAWKMLQFLSKNEGEKSNMIKEYKIILEELESEIKCRL